MKKFLFSFLAFSFLIFPITVFALTTDSVGITGPNGVESYTVNGGIHLSDKNPIDMTVRLINVAMTFLGIIAVVIILVGGFKWMTAMGSEDNIKKAKELMSAGIIGLVIILAAWGIARFVVNTLATTI